MQGTKKRETFDSWAGNLALLTWIQRMRRLLTVKLSQSYRVAVLLQAATIRINSQGPPQPPEARLPCVVNAQQAWYLAGQVPLHFGTMAPRRVNQRNEHGRHRLVLPEESPRGRLFEQRMNSRLDDVSLVDIPLGCICVDPCPFQPNVD